MLQGDREENAMEDNKDNRGVSRRSFLKGAGIAGAAVIGAGLVGCSSSGSSSSGSSSSASSSSENASAAKGETSAGAAALGASSTVNTDFMIEPMKEKGLDADETIECDFVVVGAGNCGIMAAGSASELGLKVIVLEKASQTGGSSVGTEVTMAFEDCQYMAEAGQKTGSYEDVFWYFMRQNSWESNGKLVSAYIHNNHLAHDWLYSKGAKTQMLLPSLDAPTGGIMYEGQGTGAFDVAQSAAIENGVQILTETPATNIVVDDDGAVAGILAVDSSNKVIFVKARAAFIGTGGFSNDADMVAFYIGEGGTMAFKRDSFLAHDGDGIKMLLGAGAKPARMQFAQPAASSVKDVAWEDPVDRAAREPYLWVNRNGDRLCNEKWQVMNVPYEVGFIQEGHTFFNIIDSAAATRMETMPLMTNPRTVLGSFDPDPNMTSELDAAADKGLIKKADSIADLASACGIDADRLQATIDEYNARAEAGQDTQFFKAAEYLFPISQPPYYAFELIPSWYSTLNGVQVSDKLEVLGQDGKPIPGLYAGGLDSGGFYMTNYNHGFSGGCSGYSYFTGFYAAINAAEYLGK